MEPKHFEIHSSAICNANKVGKGTRIFAFAHIADGAKIGAYCTISEYVYVGEEVKIKDGVKINPGARIWGSILVGNYVLIGPNATFSSERFAADPSLNEKDSTTIVGDHASIGANATIFPGIEIGPGALICAGSVVTKDVPPGAIVTGNPAQISGYVGKDRLPLTTTHFLQDYAPSRSGLLQELPSGAKIIQLPEMLDLRGKLSFAEVGQYLPFNPQRYFLVYDVPSQEVRGEHAHKECHQFLLCINGTITVVTDNGVTKDQIILSKPNIGLHIPPGIWGIQFKYTKDAVLLVLASHKYDASDYIREYNEFLASKGMSK